MIYIYDWGYSQLKYFSLQRDGFHVLQGYKTNQKDIAFVRSRGVTLEIKTSENTPTKEPSNSMKQSPSEELIVAQLVKIFLVSCEKRKFIAVLTRSYKRFLSWARWIQAALSDAVSVKSNLMYSLLKTQAS